MTPPTEQSANIHRLKPERIFPTEGVRVNGTALRDWQQSVASGRESPLHMSRVAPHLEQYHQSLTDNFPGVEEVGGGTVPRMDLSVRNEDPFEHVAKLKELLPTTPLMALIRSDAGAGMEEVAPDVLETYLLNYHKTGIDVFRNFHALNDPRAFVRVAQILHKTAEINGTPAHFQAAYSYATDGQDGENGTGVYNSRTPVTFFMKLVEVLRSQAGKDGLAPDAYLPHSFVIKDPSGVLTPKMATLITSEVKAAQDRGELPRLPFGIHTHNQMGHAAETCKAAIAAGANFVDCAPAPGGLGAQPPISAMVEALGGGDGAALGFADPASFEAARGKLAVVDQLSDSILKAHDPDVRQNKPDPTVPSHCIAGGQASVARAEVKAMLQKRASEGTVVSAEEVDQFMNKVKGRMPEVRKELGMPCLVTPVADYIFREAARRENGGNPDKDFYCGYRRIMTGEMGPTKEPVHAGKQEQALLERLENRLDRAVSVKARRPEVKASGALAELRDVMLEYSQPARDQERFEELNNRVTEMKALGVPATDLERQREALASGVDQRREAIGRYNAFLEIQTAELAQSVHDAANDNPLVRRYHEIVEKSPKLQALNLPAEDNIRLIKSASYTSLPLALLLPPGMEPARNELEHLAIAGKYVIPGDRERFNLDAALGRMLRDPYALDPDKIAREYFQRRDGLAPATAANTGKSHFEASAQFNAPVSTARLVQKISDAFIAQERWDAAANIEVLPAEKGAKESDSFTLRIRGVEDPMHLGVPIIRDVIRTLNKNDTAPSQAVDLTQAPDGDLGGKLERSHAFETVRKAAEADRLAARG